jgi:dCMP deaminase
LYVSLFPCNECAKAIIQSGITEIVYELDLYANTDQVKASKQMLKAAGIKLRKYKLAHKQIVINI